MVPIQDSNEVRSEKDKNEQKSNPVFSSTIHVVTKRFVLNHFEIRLKCEHSLGKLICRQRGAALPPPRGCMMMISCCLSDSVSQSRCFPRNRRSVRARAPWPIVGRHWAGSKGAYYLATVRQ